MDKPKEAVMSSRYINLRKSFGLSIHSLLTALSAEDVNRAFPSFTNVERKTLHHIFVQAIKSLHENIEDEFESICQETKVSDVLCAVDRFVEEQKYDHLSAEKSNIMDAKAKLSTVKKDELQYLENMLDKAEAQKNIIRDRIESLKSEEIFPATSNNALKKFRSWNSNFRGEL